MSTGAPAPTWPGLLSALLGGADLSAAETAWAMQQVMLGEATPVEVAGFVVALRAKGEAPDEVTGLVRAMLAVASRFTVEGPAVDTCGTGGDRANTVNISTMSAMVVAGTGAGWSSTATGRRPRPAGRPTCSRSSASWSTSSRPRPPECLDRIGVTFCFAPKFHPALRHAATPRRELGRADDLQHPRPAGQPGPAVGPGGRCADPRLAGVMAQVLADRGTSALVFRGDDGLDELTPTTTSQVWVVRDGAGDPGAGRARDVGLTRAEPDALRGGDRAHNAEVTRRFLAGEGGPVRDAVLLNAAAALVALDGATAPASLPDALRAASRAPPSRWTAGRPRERWRAGSRPAPTSRPADRRTGLRSFQDPLDADAPLLRRVWCARVQLRRLAPTSPAASAPGERGVQVVLGVGAERDVRLGGRHPVDLAELVGDHVGQRPRARAPAPSRSGRRRR
jgi:anthranilate phosphoribosyltransferase